MAAILIIWTAVTFRQPLPRPLPDNLGINYNGFSSIAVMPISLFSASVFRCAMPEAVRPFLRCSFRRLLTLHAASTES